MTGISANNMGKVGVGAIHRICQFRLKAWLYLRTPKKALGLPKVQVSTNVLLTPKLLRLLDLSHDHVLMEVSRASARYKPLTMWTMMPE